MRKPLQIKGISTASSYEDGDCLEMMNVRHEQGVLKPVESFPIDFELNSVYDILYWHKNNNYTNLIGVKHSPEYRNNFNYNAVYFLNDIVIYNDIYYKAIQDYFTRVNPSETYFWEVIPNDEVVLSSIYWIRNYGTPQETEGTPLLTLTGTNVVLSHIGNILNVLDGTTLKYIFWKDTEYLVIDTDFDGEQTDTELIGKVDLKVDGVVGINGKRQHRYYYSENAATLDADRTINLQTAQSLFLKALGIDKRDGLLSGFILARTAIELYDGSYIMASNPVLLGQAWDNSARYEFERSGVAYNYLSNKVPFYFSMNGSGNPVSWIEASSNTDKYFTLDETLFNCGTGSGSGKWNIQTDKLPSLAASLQYIKLDGGSAIRRIAVVKSANNLKFKINSTINPLYSSIIKSISVFITDEVDMNTYFDKVTNANNVLYAGVFDYNGTDSAKQENYMPTIKTNADILKELAELTTFYKVHEIPFDDIKTTTENNGWVTIDLKGKLGENLLVQPELSLDSFSNIKAQNQMVYNSMLHAWDINNVVGRGYPVNYFYTHSGIGQFNGDNLQGEIDVQGWIEFIKVKIKTDVGITEVIRVTPELQGEYLKLFNFQPMIAYPDARATELILYRQYRDSITNKYVEQERIFKLIPSKTGNFAYYISSDLKPIDLTSLVVLDTDPKYETIPAESNQQLSYQNKLKVSNVNNPFLFPDLQTYQVGDGKILNVGSQSIRTSDGQYGQFPLICFCTDGIFSLEVGDGTVAYSKAVKPQSYERPISSVICTTPFGIVFISNRGLCMVAGQEVVYLSEAVFEKFKDITLELPTVIENSFAIDTTAFNTYLKDCSAMVYNPKEQEIIIINPTKTFNYVYNFSTKQFYKNTEAITGEINNSLPSLQVWDGLLVKNVTSTSGGVRQISFVTRPIKMQTTDFKRFERIILRGYLSNIGGTPATTCVWGSNDDKNFTLLRGLNLTNGTSRKDIDFGMFGKTTFRSYIIGLSMTVGTDSEVEAIEMEIEKLYNNTKMR